MINGKTCTGVICAIWFSSMIRQIGTISIHSSHKERYDKVSWPSLICSISIHSSHKGRYSNTAQKSVIIFLQYCQKFNCFPYLLPQELLNFREFTGETIYISVRIPYSFHVSFRFAPEWHLLSITTYYSHIASHLPFYMHLLYQKEGNLIFLHVKTPNIPDMIFIRAILFCSKTSQFEVIYKFYVKFPHIKSINIFTV